MPAKPTTVKGQLLLYMLLPVLVAFFSLRLLDYVQSKRQAIALTKESVHEKTHALANRVDALVIQAGTLANTTATALSINEHWNEQTLYDLLKRNVAGNPLIYGAAIAFEPGVFEGRKLFSPYAYQFGTTVRTLDIGKESYDYTRPEWQWYALPKQLNRPVWTEPYFDEGAGNIQMVTYSVPFYRRGKLAGITTIDLDLSRLPELAAIQSEGNSRFYVLSKGGIFVYHPQNALLGKPLTAHAEEFKALDLHGLLSDKQSISAHLKEIDHDGRVDWLAAAPIKSAGWVFVSQVDATAEMQQVEKNLQQIILRAIAVLTIAIIALYIFIGHLLAPISRLAKAAKQVAAGLPFDFKMPRSRSEITDLAQDIASMTGQLQQREDTLQALNEELEETRRRLLKVNVDLEQRVQERTLALQTAMDSLQENEARFRHMLETSPIAVRIARASGRDVIFANQRYRELINAGSEETAGIDPKPYYANQQDYEEILATLDSGGEIYDRLVELNIPGYGKKWALASYLQIHYEGEPAVLGWFYDITARKLLEENLQLAGLVYANSSEGMVVTNEHNRIIAINPAFTEMTGYSEEDVLGQDPKILSSGKHEPEFYREMWQSISTTGRWQGEIMNRRKDGSDYIEWLSINTIFNQNGGVHRRVALFSDITEKKKTESLIWNQANYDHLTQLPNRRLFHDRLEQEILKAKRDGSHTALLFIDLDRFKEVNDTLGHDVGDLLLVEATKRLKHCVRGYDTLARLGGDEFTVVLSELQDSTHAARVAKNIIENLSKPFKLVNQEIFISASIGISMYPDDAKTTKDLIKHADQAMYEAKAEGRSRFHFFTRALQNRAESRMRLAADLRSAVKARQFQVYYQPIVCMSTGKIHKAEALLRWQHPEQGFISPAAFIPVAEDTGLINEIGDWVFAQAIQQVGRWQRMQGPDFQISINKSPVQFAGDGRDHEHWVEELAASGLEGHSVVIEITEGLLMNTETSVTKKLLRFRDAGIQVAIDDFGTGYSALSYLNKFDIDYLKIDQSFTRNLEPDSQDLALCEAIVVMAHKLGLKVIAEGVETQMQHDLLKQIGCDYGQGYLYSRPVPVAEFEKLLG